MPDGVDATTSAGPSVTCVCGYRAKAKIADCDHRLERYRAALEAGTDPVLVGKWIAEVRAERITADRQLADATPAPRLTKDEIKALVASLHDMVAVLANADAADKAAVYAELGISLTYHPDGRVLVESRLPCSQVRVGGGT